MKRIFLSAMTTLALFLLVACGGEKPSESLIVGTWDAVAPMEISEFGVQIVFSDITSTYHDNHTSTSSGKMIMSGDVLPNTLEMTISVQSTWSIKANTITETITDADISTQTSLPDIPDFAQTMAEKMKSEGAKKSTIVALDATTLILKEFDNGAEITMKRQ